METSTDFAELLQLTARTVDYICKSLRVMHNKIESICKQMGNSLNCEYNMDKNDSHSEFKECKRVNTPFFRAATKKALLREKSFLRTRGIFPTRVYLNKKVVPLLSRGKVPDYQLPQSKIHSGGENSKLRAQEPSHSNNNISAIIPNLIMEEEDIDANIQEVFPELPDHEQQEVINRLSELMERLGNLRANRRQVTTPAPATLSADMEVDMAMDVNDDLTSIAGQMQSTDKCPEEPSGLHLPPLQLSELRTKDLQLSNLGAKSKDVKNGSVVHDIEGALDQITSAD
ncbi:UNVERIFIED_CONTAM: hypothetical protein K2H54_050589 [Gekko kuhli]